MDGNGRWANRRGLKRTEGHAAGEEALWDATMGALELGVEWFTVYAFSTENWRRSADEVRFLMGFNREVVRRRRENLDIMGVQMRWVGSRARMWPVSMIVHARAAILGGLAGTGLTASGQPRFVVPLDLFADALAPPAAQDVTTYLAALQPVALARVAAVEDPLLP